MSVRTKVLGLVDVIMRVPPLFIIDEILKISMGLPSTTTHNSILDSSSDLDLLTINDTQSATFMNQNLSDELFNVASLEQQTVKTLAGSSVQDVDFLKVLSLTALKFIVCLFGECNLCNH